jgi:signal transduction histidine kinase
LLRGENPPALRPLRTFARVGGAVIATVATIDLALWFGRASLPRLVTAHAALVAATSGHPVSVTPVDLVLGLGDTVAFLLAAALTMVFLSRAPWLPVALVLAAGARTGMMFFPTIDPDRVSIGDLLGLAFAIALLVAFSLEMRRLFRSERRLIGRLQVAYEAEEARVNELESDARARHDLRTVVDHELLHPIATIRALALTLSGRWRSLDDDEAEQALDALAAESAVLCRLADDAIAVSHIDAVQFRLRPAPEDPAELAHTAANAALGLEDRLRVEVATAPGTTVCVDRVRILQVLRNLLSNAAKYSDPGTSVELRVCPEGADVQFSVVNSGAEIAECDRERVFARSGRLAVHEAVPGSGLGLSISRNIVTAHGGSIWTSTLADGRTVFALTVPGVASVR